MHVMLMHKHQAKVETGEPPSSEIVSKMGALIGGYVKSGRLVDGAGLGATKTRTRLRFRDGSATIQHGPYAGESELPARLALLKVATREEGLVWAERYGRALGDCDLELGYVNEPWDIGLMPRPENPPVQLLLVEKSDSKSEGHPRTAKQEDELGKVEAAMKEAGVLARTRKLAPSSNAKRLTFKKNKLSIVDGPFSESKELIGGFAILDLSGFDEAIEVAVPYAEILGDDLEIDLRMVTEDDG